MTDDTAASSVEGSGWMFGPYMTARLAPSLYLDARLVGGSSSNEVSPFKTYTDDFDTTRWLAEAGLSGDFRQGHWTFQPNVRLSWYRDTSDDYIDGTGAAVPSQTVELGQIKAGPALSGRFVVDDGSIVSPYFSLDAIFNWGESTGVGVTGPDTSVE